MTAGHSNGVSVEFDKKDPDNPLDDQEEDTSKVKDDDKDLKADRGETVAAGSCKTAKPAVRKKTKWELLSEEAKERHDKTVSCSFSSLLRSLIALQMELLARENEKDRAALTASTTSFLAGLGDLLGKLIPSSSPPSAHT